MNPPEMFLLQLGANKVFLNLYLFLLFTLSAEPFLSFILLSSSLVLSPTKWLCVLHCRGLGTSSRKFIRLTASLPPPPPLFLPFPPDVWVSFICPAPIVKAVSSKAPADRCGCMSVCMCLWGRGGGNYLESSKNIALLSGWWTKV